MTGTDDLITKFNGLADAYPEDVWPSITSVEAIEIRNTHPHVIDRASAMMGRHLGKYFREAATALADQAAQIERLTRERDEARRYCSAAYHDLVGLFETIKGNKDLFPRTTHDLIETSEFMKLAAEGLADGTIYNDELSKEKSRAETAERELDEAREQLRMQWCLACGTVSADGGCDCTADPDTANLRQAVDYAQEFGKMMREQARELAEAKAEVERLKAENAEMKRALAQAGKTLSTLDRTNARLNDALINIIDCDRHNHYDGPPPRYVQIARAALAHGGE